MNINASIIDQRLTSLVANIQTQIQTELKIVESVKVKSVAFVYLCVQTILDLEHAEAFDCLTEGGGDFGVDAIHISEEYDGEFTVSLFQAKYKKNLEGDSNFPENGIKALINAINYLFDPSAQLEYTNRRLLTKVEEARSLIRDGYIPQVRAIACNNGLTWNDSAQEEIKRAGFGEQVSWEHVNHERLVSVLQASKPVKDTLQLVGAAVVEDMNYSRVLVGKISVLEVAALIERHGERLLERNIRRYLGLQGNRVNEAIRDTLLSDEKANFYFYNNGLTLTCDTFVYNALQNGDYRVRVDNLQIINGSQTCLTIFRTLQENIETNQDNSAYVLLRLYQLPRDNNELIQKITYATNSQNPVDLRDLRANDDRQQKLEIDIQQLGYQYRRKRSESSTRSTDITSGVAAAAVLSVWRKKPHQAKFFAREHFGKLYDFIFTNRLNGAQVIISVQLFRLAENRRKRPESTDLEFIRYASYFIAMQMGQKLLKDIDIRSEDELDHTNFDQASQLIERHGENYLTDAVEDVRQALKSLYGKQTISFQQLSATFRRGDLIEKLQQIA
ncbi:AIPR family protein [cf. Phormidesmis sp. LEGE 11477]|uniref:AIPR family protein n=1 Tax=cf. Phormidesmis sp. LEGE 11477 TaxID=1828680 RepID=UPI00187EA94A|nr:AIPR family protein [cf. Phormidesmis sp. LEGE 11477]MBE9059517.1 AIPR family protein [cf. Phormidesmis sp. LEGE 11477]